MKLQELRLCGRSAAMLGTTTMWPLLMVSNLIMMVMLVVVVVVVITVSIVIRYE